MGIIKGNTFDEAIQNLKEELKKDRYCLISISNELKFISLDKNNLEKR